MAKKSKGFGELLRQQQEDRVHQKALESLQKKVQQGSLSSRFDQLVANPKGEVKMSEVLEEFVEPYLDFARNLAQREKLFSIAVVAWNVAIMPDQNRQPMINQLIGKGLPGSDSLAQHDVREIIDEMITRKQQFFAENKRYIVDFQLQDMGKQFHLSVASTLTQPTTPEP